MTIRTLISIPDPKPIASDLIEQCKGFGLEGARQDVHPDDHPLVTAMLRSYLDHPDFFPIFLLAGGRMTRSDDQPWEPEHLLQHVRDTCQKLLDLGFKDRELALETGNEPDLAHKRWKKNPAELGKLYKEAIGAVKSFSSSWHCLSPSISNLDEDSLEYLDEMALPVGAEIAYHRYPPGRDFWASHRGFRTRGDEVERLKKIANGAPLWATEVGWSEHSRDYTLTESEVASRLADEVEFWNDVGVEALVIYQLNSGTIYAGDSHDEKRLASYGLRRVDNSWKPAATLIKETKERLG